MTAYDRLFEECEKSIIFYTEHLSRLRSLAEQQEKATTILLEFNQKSDLSDFLEIEKINNYNGYITIAMLDLSVNLKNLIRSETEWESAFFIKNSFLIIHETAKKLKPFKGKSFIQFTIEQKYHELNDDLKDLFNDIDNFRNASTYNKISTTRHSIAGHIEDNLKLYYDTVKELDGEEAGNLIIQFIQILDQAMNLTNNFARIANNKQKEKTKIKELEFNSNIKKLTDILKL